MFFWLIRTSSCSISEARHAVTRVLSLTGCGNFPDLTPAHQTDLDTGYSRKTSVRRRKPSSSSRFCGGISVIECSPILFGHDESLPYSAIWGTVRADLRTVGAVNCSPAPAEFLGRTKSG